MSNSASSQKDARFCCACSYWRLFLCGLSVVIAAVCTIPILTARRASYTDRQTLASNPEPIPVIQSLEHRIQQLLERNHALEQENQQLRVTVSQKQASEIALEVTIPSNQSFDAFNVHESGQARIVPNIANHHNATPSIGNQFRSQDRRSPASSSSVATFVSAASAGEVSLLTHRKWVLEPLKKHLYTQGKPKMAGRNHTERRLTNIEDVLRSWAQTQSNILRLPGQMLEGIIPDWIGTYTQLIYVDLSNNNLQGPIPPSMGNLSNLQYLNLNNNYISGKVPDSLGTVAGLRAIHFANNQLSGTIPSSFCNLSSLEEVELISNSLIGTIPECVGNLTSLMTFTVSANQLSGHIPSSLGNLIKLQYLWLDTNSFTGTIPPSLGHLSNLKDLFLYSNQLEGSIPDTFQNLASLQRCALNDNRISGAIPDFIGSLVALNGLWLFANQLTGEIPASLGNLNSLLELVLNNNQLSGTLPESFGNLTRLMAMQLSSNQLSGPIPESYGKLEALGWLYLSDNKLSGSIPASLGKLGSIQEIYLDKNLLSGHIPASLGNLATLQVLRLSSNQLSGEIPDSLGDLTNLIVMCADDNHLSGNIPVSLGNLENLQILYLALNRLSGPIPASLGQLRHLTALYLQYNKLSEAIPAALANLSSLVNIALNNNYLFGIIPESFGSLHSLQRLHLYANELSGTLPSSLGNLDQLIELWLGPNQFSGSIPDSFGYLSNLQRLDLKNNRLSGIIPRSLGNLMNLTVLALNQNELSGTIPETFGNLMSLEEMHLFSNNLSGVIPEGLGNLTYLRILNLNSNALTGTVPESLANLGRLQELFLATNGLSGVVPFSLGRLTALTEVQLQHNNFSGSIPLTVGNWVNVNRIDLSFNNFEGEVPMTFGNMSLLSELLLSHNRLNGSLPDFSKTHLVTLEASFNRLSGVTAFNSTAFQGLDISSNQLMDVSGILRNLPELRVLNLAFNNISHWPRAGVWPRSLFEGYFISSLDFWFDSLPDMFEDRLSLTKLLVLNVSHNPFWADKAEPDYDALAFLNSISDLSSLTVVDASGCNLKGDIPYIARAADQHRAGVNWQVFRNLAFLGLSNNRITQIAAPIPKRLLVVDLSNNSLGLSTDVTKPILERTWWLNLRQLNVLQNPQLRAFVYVLDKELGCSTGSSSDGLVADPFSYRQLTTLESSALQAAFGFSSSVGGFECTSLCSRLNSDLNVDFGMLNLTSLCRCLVGWQGIGANCTPCNIDNFGFWSSLGDKSLCKSCPPDSSTFGLAAQAHISSCKCKMGTYLLTGADSTVGLCQPCEPGTFTNNYGTFGHCNSCPPGTATSINGSTMCFECPEGQFASSSIGAKSCKGCPAGRFQANRATTDCSVCFPGTFSSEGSVLCNSCPKGRYQSQNGTDTCIACPVGFDTATVGSTNRSDCVCPKDTYFAANSCLPCLEGASCPGGLGLFTLRPGYYSNGPDVSQLFKCSADDYTSASICAGGNPLVSACLGGRIGFLCQDCPDGSTPDGRGVCLECTSSQYIVILIAGLAGVILLVLVTVAAVRLPLQQLPQSVDIFCTASQLLNAIQILAAIQSIGLAWSNPFDGLLSILKFFSVDLDVIRIRCLTRSNSFSNYILRLSVPIIGVVLLAIGGILLNFLQRRLIVGVNSFVSACGRVLVAVYISICLVTLTALHCYSHPSQQKSLVAYPSVICWEDGLHTGMLGYSIAAILIYVVGLFTTAAFAIWQYPKVILTDSLNFIRRFGFLFSNWSPSCYWFSAVLLLRNLMVALLPKLIAPEFNQITLVLIQLVLIIHLSFVLMFFPWRTLKLNKLDIMLCVVFQCILAGGIISNFKPEASLAVSIILFSLCLLALCACIGYIALKFLSLHMNSKTYSFFISHHKATGACTARLLKTLLSRHLTNEIFYDSDNLNDLAGIVRAVQTTECLVVLLTSETLCRPWCAAEIITAAQLGIPFVPMTVGNSPKHESDFKDRYQSLNQEALEQLYHTFEILRPHGINLDDTASSYELLLNWPTLHLNVSDPSDVASKVKLLLQISNAIYQSRKGGNCSAFFRSHASLSAREVVGNILQQRTSQVIDQTEESTLIHTRSLKFVKAMSSVSKTMTFHSTLSQAIKKEASTGERWLVMTDPKDFEASSAGRFVKVMLQVSLQTDIVLDIELSTLELERQVASFSVFLWFCSLGSLSSASQLARLVLVNILRPQAVIKPVMVTDAFRFPDEVYYSELQQNGGRFGSQADELFSDIVDQDICCADVAVSLRSVFQNISTFVNVPVASEGLLKASIAQLVNRVKQSGTHEDRKLLQPTTSSQFSKSKSEGKESVEAAQLETCTTSCVKEPTESASEMRTSL